MKLPNFSAYLPSKKFIFVVLIGLIIIAAGFLIFTPAEKQESAKQKPQISKLASQEIAKDSDNDGLPDWEEALWGTDPANPDTDKDGVPDGKEIKENRNPLLAGDGKTDKIESPKPAKSPAEQAMQLSSTLTEALGQEFFSEYMRLKQESSGELSEFEKTELVNSLVSGLENSQNKPSGYSESDIKIASLDDEKTIKDYGNNLALIIKKYFDPLPEIEMTIFQRALDNKNESELKKLVPIALAYRNTAKEALSLETPETFSESHLAIINSFDEIAKAIDGLTKVFDDPAQSLLALEQYRKKAVIAYLFLRNLYAYFLYNKIVFQNNEPAKLFEFYWQKI